jgi:hypothetical protein
MKRGDIVRFKEVIDVGDDELRMVALEDEDGGRVLVQALVGMSLNPTARYNVSELEVCGAVHSKQFH